MVGFCGNYNGLFYSLTNVNFSATIHFQAIPLSSLRALTSSIFCTSSGSRFHHFVLSLSRSLPSIVHSAICQTQKTVRPESTAHKMWSKKKKKKLETHVYDSIAITHRQYTGYTSRPDEDQRQCGRCSQAIRLNQTSATGSSEVFFYLFRFVNFKI